MSDPGPARPNATIKLAALLVVTGALVVIAVAGACAFLVTAAVRAASG